MDSRIEGMLATLSRRLPKGRQYAIPANVIAAELGVSTRTVRELIGELTDRGHLVGSNCSGETPGYFLICDFEDLDVGTRHLRSRSLSMLRRYRTLQRVAGERFGAEALRLFDLDEVAV